MIHFLAEVAAHAADNDMVSVKAVTAIIGAIFIGLGVLAGKLWGERKAQSVNISNQPLDVQLKEAFVTRREFEKLESRLEVSVSDMKGLFREAVAEFKNATNLTLKRMEGQNDRLTKKIEDIGTGAYQGRQKIWEQVNHQREGLAALTATSDVAAQIEKLAEAIQPSTVKVQPTHPTSK